MKLAEVNALMDEWEKPKEPARAQEILRRGKEMKDDSHKMWDRISEGIKSRKARESLDKVGHKRFAE